MVVNFAPQRVHAQPQASRPRRHEHLKHEMSRDGEVTSQKELSCNFEELFSSKVPHQEELCSSNEELGFSNEELGSSNEELLPNPWR